MIQEGCFLFGFSPVDLLPAAERIDRLSVWVHTSADSAEKGFFFT